MSADVLGCSIDQWRCTPLLDDAVYREIRQRMALDGFKWDVQIGDHATLAPFALVLPRAVWQGLATAAEALASELAAAEQELTGRPELWPELGLPGRIIRALETTAPWTRAAARVIRFDFHPTPDGWRISEANSDVPGGYTEASYFTGLMQPHVGQAAPAGNPASTLCAALAARCNRFRRLALVAAPGYIEDQQIIAYLARELRGRGIETHLARPDQLHAIDGVAHVGLNGNARPLDLIFRFYQGEWMTRLHGDAWHFYFRGSSTPVCNPGTALLTESKRLPLVWDRLRTPMPTWKRLLPLTHPPTRAWFQRNGDWVLKAAYGNTGNEVFSRAWSPPRVYWSAVAASVVTPRRWAVQKRFEMAECATPQGPRRPCIGVYTINGRAAGIYGRLARAGWIDFAAADVAVFVET